MSSLQTILDAPISWTKAAIDPDVRSILEDLQANILKGHGRHHSVHIFFKFRDQSVEQASEIIRILGNVCTSAYEQLRANKRLPPFLDGGKICCLFLSASGYKALGITDDQPEPAFAEGMVKRGAALKDPPSATWDDRWRYGQPDAMFMIADADQNKVRAELELVKNWLQSQGVELLAIDEGLQQTRKFHAGAPEGVEHFGYVDGRSQPLFLQEDIDEEATATGGWDFRFKPSQFLVADPHGVNGFSAGSFFVYRKLEQNVRGFNKAEETLGRAIYNIPASVTTFDETQQANLDRAGAMVVGRFEDGTPLTMSQNAKGEVPVNNFDYMGDASASRCPFHAHIRKVNPRGDIDRMPRSTVDPKDPVVNADDGRRPIMARRGITYGALRPHNKDFTEFSDAGHEPEKDVGLIFMAYMASIVNQFEFTQASWANNPNFATKIFKQANEFSIPGTDPTIAQGDRAEEVYNWPDTDKKLGFANFVTLKGGEYLFAPSLSFLRGVGLTSH